MVKFIKENNKKNYDTPKINVIDFDYKDVITTSDCFENRIGCPEDI